MEFGIIEIWEDVGGRTEFGKNLEHFYSIEKVNKEGNNEGSIKEMGS